MKMVTIIHRGTNFITGYFHNNNRKNCSRSWFAWLNTLFGELPWETYNKYPEALKM
ncbi:glycoside hydrolase family 125 protein [Flavobacterium sp. GT2N3]|uniref:glycoside hydrolase family 125 protein n=1 Tax=unclassified Flavobacterium TaxID=196869 RepID=UPI003AAF8C7F